MTLKEFELRFTNELEDDWNSWGRRKYLNWSSFVYMQWRKRYEFR